jgi:uncharacterized oxidoreductase
MRLQGKTALVTGGTDGIGAQLIRQLRAKGVTVITQGRNAERCAATRAEGFEVIAADLSTPAGVEALIAGLGTRDLDILVNNAGVQTDYDFRNGEVDLPGAESTVLLNLNAPVQIIARLLPGLRSRPEAVIVNVTSGLAIAPNAGSPVYCASKAGLRSYTLAIRHQLQGTGVKVLEALPPLVDTRMTAGRGENKMSAAECARQIVAGMERGTETISVGMVKLLQVVHSISPALARRIMIKF